MPWLDAFSLLVQPTGATITPDALAIDDPAAGHFEGADAVAAYLSASDAWLRARDANTRHVATTVGEGRRVGEYEVDLTVDGRRITLPLAVMVAPQPPGMPLAVRIYHSQWPLLGRHRVRHPLLAADPLVTESDIVGTYQRALAAGDAAAIVATFEPDGCFREPAGPQFRVCGTADLSAFFARFFSAGGGIVLEHCTVTEDGIRTALEFNAVRWGGVELPPQAGIAVYERGASGRLAHARVYDDVEGPVE
jgi:SnoaL-like protein